MHPADLRSRTALVLSLSAYVLAPQVAMSQAADPDTLALFAPEVAQCLETGAPAQCDAYIVAMTTCAEDPGAALCAELLAPEVTLADPEAQGRVRDALAAFSAAVLAVPAEGQPSDPEPDSAEPANEPAAPTPDSAADPVPEEQIAPEPPPEAAVEAATPDEAAQTDATPEPAPPEAATAGDSVTAETTPAPEAEAGAAPEADDTPSVEAETTDPAETSTEAAQIAEITRLLEDAEAAPTVEPEVVEEAIVETDALPAEAPAPELNERDRALVDELSRQPEVAAALGILGAALTGETAPRDLSVPEPGAITQSERPAEVVEDQIAETEIRRSTDDFASGLTMRPEVAMAAPGNSRRQRDLERAGLAALGALAIGMIVNENRVVARGDERVIVQGADGDLQIWRDDDAILRTEGGNRRIERYADGTTVSEWSRADGARVVTVRDATGRVLSRQRVLADGTTIALLDDSARVEPIDVSVLPEMRYRELRLGAGTDPDRALALLERAEADARAVGRSFSLRQIREVRQVRELVPVLSPDPITFETNRANIRADEVPKLLQVGRVIERLILRNPREVFLIEGHSDATGSAAYNLGLSDRRAESVALALTEFFRIPPENLIVQGYGESYLRVQTQVSDERNRRVVMRRITPLLAQ